MEKSNIIVSLQSNQMVINHNGLNEISAQFIVRTFKNGDIVTELIIEHNDYRTHDLLVICEKLGLTTKCDYANLTGRCFTKILGLPYDGLGGSIRNAFQIVWDYYLCF